MFTPSFTRRINKHVQGVDTNTHFNNRQHKTDERSRKKNTTWTQQRVESSDCFSPEHKDPSSSARSDKEKQQIFSFERLKPDDVLKRKKLIINVELPSESSGSSVSES